MNEWDKARARAEILKEQYPAGTRIMLKRMEDIQAPPFGTLGTVQGVDDIGSILVQWDNGSTLSVTEVDEVVIIGKGVSE